MNKELCIVSSDPTSTNATFDVLYYREARLKRADDVLYYSDNGGFFLKNAEGEVVLCIDDHDTRSFMEGFALGLSLSTLPRTIAQYPAAQVPTTPAPNKQSAEPTKPASPDPLVLEIAEEHAGESAPPTADTPPPLNEEGSTEISADKVDELLSSLIDDSIINLSADWSNWASHVIRVVARPTDDRKPPDECLELVTILRNKNRELENNCIEFLNQRAQRIYGNREAAAAEPPPLKINLSSLALADSAPVTNDVLMRVLQDNVTNDVSMNFAQLNRRMSHLLGKPLKPVNNPISILSIGAAIIDGFEKNNVNRDAFKWAFEIMAPAISQSVEKLYAQLNAHLIEESVLPDLTFHIWRRDE